jgi:uncharacterized repeat protein (TIGR01451 family)
MIPDRSDSHRGITVLSSVNGPSLYDPLAVRLVKCYGIVIVSLNDGTEQLIPFEDRLCFENIPANNTGAVGLVYYEFMPLASGRTAQLTPYQEVASGYDNEKFNGDYGNSVGGFTSTAPAVTFDKTGTAVVTGGDVATYTLTAGNTGTAGLGIPELSLPFVFEDSIPAGLVYLAGSATSANSIPVGNSVTVSWSTDGGASWVLTEPAAAGVTHIRWTLASALAPATTATVGFQATVPITYPSVTVTNTSVIKLGPTGELATDTATSLVSGINCEDTDNNGVVDAGTDAVVAVATTGPAGAYLFGGLAAGNYLVDVDQNAAAIPSDTYGNKYRLTTADPHDVTLGAGQAYLTADFGFTAAATIGDFVFFVSNGNGTQDFTETGIPDVTVELYQDVDQDGQPDSPTPVATTVTADGTAANPAGFYQFVDLGAGTWFVKVRTGTLPLAGGLPIPLTSDPDREGVPVGDNTYPGLTAGDDGDSLVIISLGGNYTGADFGYQPSGALGDFVWLDLDQDVVQDAGEQGVSGPVEDQRLIARVATNGDKQLAAAVPVGKMAQNADGQ